MQEPKLNIDLKQAEDVPCKSCGNVYFYPTVMLKQLSALLSPTGQELKFPVNVLQCTSCKEYEVPFSEE